MATSDKVKSKETGTARYDLFKDVKPYYGTVVQCEKRDNVPTLFTICVQSVIDKELVFESLPTVLCSKLSTYKQYAEYKGPKIYKCSECSKFYSKHNKFLEHICD